MEDEPAVVTESAQPDAVDPVFPGDQPSVAETARDPLPLHVVDDDAIALDPSVRRGPASAHLLPGEPASVGRDERPTRVRMGSRSSLFPSTRNHFVGSPIRRSSPTATTVMPFREARSLRRVRITVSPRCSRPRCHQGRVVGAPTGRSSKVAVALPGSVASVVAATAPPLSRPGSRRVRRAESACGEGTGSSAPVCGESQVPATSGRSCVIRPWTSWSSRSRRPPRTGG